VLALHTVGGPPLRPRTAKATEVFAERAAARAVEDRVKLARAARIFRHALQRGLVDRDGHLVDAARRHGEAS